LIKAAKERLIIISPFLKFNDRIRELLQDKDRMKIDVRIVYGKTELAPHEINWLRSLDYVRTSFCQNLHAKCYLNESAVIITSMNLYDFSQVNNNEMGVFIKRDEETELYRETYEEAQRLIRVSEEVRLSAEKVEKRPKPGKPEESKAKSPEKPAAGPATRPAGKPARRPAAASAAKPPSKPAGRPAGKTGGGKFDKLTTSKLATALGIRTAQLVEKLVAKGWIEKNGDKQDLTDAGRKAGGESRVSKQHGPYFIWPKDTEV
jgi:hypothetical protein